MDGDWDFGGVETARRCQDWIVGIVVWDGLVMDEVGFGDKSRMQYARLRIPISMLRIRVSLEAFWMLLVISSCRRWERMDFVPELAMPHLNAIVFN